MLGWAWLMLAVHIFLIVEAPSARNNGVAVLGTTLLAVVFAFLWRRAYRPLKKHKVVLGLLAITVVVAVLSLDWKSITTRGITLNVAPLVVLLLSLLPSRD